MSFHIMSYIKVISCHIISSHAMSCHVISCPVIRSDHVMSNHVMSHHPLKNGLQKGYVLDFIESGESRFHETFVCTAMSHLQFAFAA